MQTVAVQNPAVPSAQLPDAPRGSGASFAEALAATGQASPAKGHEACPGKWPPGQPAAVHRMTGPPSDAQSQGDPTDPVQKVDARSKTTGEPEASKNTEPAAQSSATTVHAFAAPGSDVVAMAAQTVLAASQIALTSPVRGAQSPAPTAEPSAAAPAAASIPFPPATGTQYAMTSPPGLQGASLSGLPLSPAVTAVPDAAVAYGEPRALPEPTDAQPSFAPQAAPLPSPGAGGPDVQVTSPLAATVANPATMTVAPLSPSVPDQAVAALIVRASSPAQPAAPGATFTSPVPASRQAPQASESTSQSPSSQASAATQPLPQVPIDDTRTVVGSTVPVGAAAAPQSQVLPDPVHLTGEPVADETVRSADPAVIQRAIPSPTSDATNRMERAAVLGLSNGASARAGGVSDMSVRPIIAGVEARPLAGATTPTVATASADGAGSLPFGPAPTEVGARPQLGGPGLAPSTFETPVSTSSMEPFAETAPAPAAAAPEADTMMSRAGTVAPAAGPDETQQVQQAQSAPTSAPAAPAARMAAEAPGAPSSAAAHVERAQATQQVMDRIEMMRVAGGRQESTLHLRPDHLGSLRITVVSEGDQVTARIVAESSSTRQMLQDEREQLRQGLAERGYNLQHLDVGSGGAGPGARHQTAARDAQWAAAVRQDTVRSADASVPTVPQRVAAPTWAGRLDCTA